MAGRRFKRRADGSYFAHQPLYGFGSPESEPGHIARIARTLNLLRWIVPLEPKSVLDIGGGEGYLAALIRHLTDAAVVSTDLSIEACARARELFGEPSLACPADSQPFPDASFDLVVLSEVIEHLEDPFAAIAEAKRLARKWLLITTQEVELDPAVRKLRLLLRTPEVPHTELNWWTPEDFAILLGAPVCAASQYLELLPRDEPRLSPAAARRLILRAADVDGLMPKGVGIMAIWNMSGGEDRPAPPIPLSDDRVSDWLKLLTGSDLVETVARKEAQEIIPSPSVELAESSGVPMWFPAASKPHSPLPNEETVRAILAAPAETSAIKRAALARKIRQIGNLRFFAAPDTPLFKLRWLAAKTIRWLLKRIGISTRRR